MTIENLRSLPQLTSRHGLKPSLALSGYLLRDALLTRFWTDVWKRRWWQTLSIGMAGIRGWSLFWR